MRNRLASLVAILLLAACSGGGGGPAATPPIATGNSPVTHTASEKSIPTSAFWSVNLTCDSAIGDLTVSADGSAWFTQPFNCNYHPEGDLIGRVSTSGAVTLYHTPTANSGPFGIVFASDSNLYAAEENAGKLARIDPATGAITEFAIPPYQGQAPNVRFVGIGSDGNVWFTNIAEGAYALGTFNIATHQFAWYPLGMQASIFSKTIGGPQGKIWVSNINTAHGGTAPFGVFTTSGASSAQYQVPTPLGDITSASDGNIWFTQLDAGPPYQFSLGRSTPSGSISSFPLPSGVNYAALTGIAQGHDGNIYAGLFNNNAIVQSTLEGSMTVYSFPPSCNIVQPAVLTAGNGDTLWVADNGNIRRIYQVNLDALH